MRVSRTQALLFMRAYVELCRRTGVMVDMGEFGIVPIEVEPLQQMTDQAIAFPDIRANCHKCKFARPALHSGHHKQCTNTTAHVLGKQHGIDHGWFFWPLNFDPVWLVFCDGYEEEES